MVHIWLSKFIPFSGVGVRAPATQIPLQHPWKSMSGFSFCAQPHRHAGTSLDLLVSTRAVICAQLCGNSLGKTPHLGGYKHRVQ